MAVDRHGDDGRAGAGDDGVIAYAPKLTKAVPAPLMGILVTTVIVLGFGRTRPLWVTCRCHDDLEMTFWERADLPSAGLLMRPWRRLPAGVTLPSVSGAWNPSGWCCPMQCVLAAVGLIESLMTLSLIDEITETRGRGNRECIGQGLGNVVCGFFNAAWAAVR